MTSIRSLSTSLTSLPAGAAGPHQRPVHPRLPRGEATGWGLRHHPQRANGRADRGRPVLGGELATAWNRIARTVAASHQLDDWGSARLFGLLNMALADGYIASFESKYNYRFWRPVTAIREGAADGNPNTLATPPGHLW